MAPQDDLTAERADLKEIARKLVLQINEITPAQWDKQDDKDQAIIIAAIQTARQEALREAAIMNCTECCGNGRPYKKEIYGPTAAGNYGHMVADGISWPPPGNAIPCKSSSIWLALDRLASEGG